MVFRLYDVLPAIDHNNNTGTEWTPGGHHPQPPFIHLNLGLSMDDRIRSPLILPCLTS